jgi:hypothetical protein
LSAEISIGDGLNVVNREGSDLAVLVIEADGLERRAVGIEIDGVRIVITPFGLAAVERLIQHLNAARGRRRLCQFVDGFGVWSENTRPGCGE